MTPMNYETLIDQLINEDVDMDELRDLVSAEKEARKKKSEAKIKDRRESVTSALINYISALTGEDPSWGFENMINDAFEEIERSVAGAKEFKGIKTDANGKKTKITKEEANEEIDKVRKWLDHLNGRKEIQF